ncbi:MAG TPA: hypothetical protein VEP93_07840 [Variovorax sp.]|nr:hypothetical protein [Variovorax sp.]
MGVMEFLRRRRVIRKASLLIDSNYQVQQRLAGRSPPEGAGRAIVLELWRKAPELVGAPTALPAPALLAAGALVEAVRNANQTDDRLEVEALHSALLMLWIPEAHRIAPFDHLSAFERLLFHQIQSTVMAIWDAPPLTE